MRYRIAIYLKGEAKPIPVLEPDTKEEGETLLRQWQFSQGMWVTYGERMLSLQLEEQQCSGDVWEPVYIVRDPWR